MFDDLDETYRLFQVARHLARSVQRRREQLAKQQETYLRDLRHVELGPDWEMLVHEWGRIVRRYASLGVVPPLPFWLPGMTPQAETQPDAAADTEMQRLLAHPEDIIPPSGDLEIQKIEMASPGGFTLRGLGEPIKQLRELIKDLWYRNRQERERGDLELVRQRLEICSEYGLPPQQVLVLAVRVTDNQRVIGHQIDAGKLTLAGEESLRTDAADSEIKRAKRKKKKGSD
jgi:hypothetical protein